MKIAVDLDGTLAEYHHWECAQHIGKPIPLMVDRVRQWLKEGHEIVIFTARIDGPADPAVEFIHDWLVRHGLPLLYVTNIKQRDFAVFYDDRCVQVEPNTGFIVTEQAQVWVAGLQRLLNMPK